MAISYEDIPDFPRSTVQGHQGALVFGGLDGVPTVAMKGRIHSYEGYPLWLCAMPVRVMKLLGIETLIVTNAAGGVNPQYKTGDLMVIKDHLNIPGFAGNNPLRGPNDARWGPRFVPMNRVYNQEYRDMVKSIAKKLGMDSFMREGVYCMCGGPCYETVSEVKYIRLMGGDAVGMSTIHEVIVGAHCGLNILAISLITNICVADENEKREVNHREVIEVGKQRARLLQNLISEFVKNIVKSRRMSNG